MFDISLSELLLVFVIGILVLKPKDLINILTKIRELSINLSSKRVIRKDPFYIKKINFFNKNKLHKKTQKKNIEQ